MEHCLHCLYQVWQVFVAEVENHFGIDVEILMREYVSSVTEAELLYGLAKRGYPKGLLLRVREFLIRVDVLAWGSDVAAVYGDLCARCEVSGVSLSPLDLMIAAHASAVGAVLVSRDKVFSRVPNGLMVEEWGERT